MIRNSRRFTYMWSEFKKYLSPLYIVFYKAQKKKPSHHHLLGGTSFLLWYIDSTLSCKGKKVLCGEQCRMTLFIIMMSWFFFCFPQFNSSGFQKEKGCRHVSNLFTPNFPLFPCSWYSEKTLTIIPSTKEYLDPNVNREVICCENFVVIIPV